jgi:lysophospholipase L1-like esterase
MSGVSSARARHRAGRRRSGRLSRSDNVHPNDQGYVYMANVWYAAIEDLLRK